MSEDILIVGIPLLSIAIGIGTLGTFIYKMGAWINKKADDKSEKLKEITVKNNEEFRKYTDERWSTNHEAIQALDKRFDIVDSKADEKAAELKKIDEETAKELKERNERIASGIAKVALDTAGSVAKVATDTAFTLKENNEKIAISLKENTKEMATTLKENNEKIAENLKNVTTDIASNIKLEAGRIAAVLKISADEKENALKLKIDEVKKNTVEMLEGLTDRSDVINENVANIKLDISDLQEDVIELYSAEDIENERTDNGRDVEIDRGHGRDGLSARKNKKRLEIERRKKRRQIETDRVNQDHPLHGTGRK